MTRARNAALAVLAAATIACGFNLTGPFEGFDGAGSRIHGAFASEPGAQAAAQPIRAFSGNGAPPDTGAAGIEVSVQERPSLSAVVGGDGTFSIVGVPSGAWTLVFARGGHAIGQVRFDSVRSNQEIRIVLTVSAGEVVLIEESRDGVSFQDECPRGPGFWCQNQDGKNPNLTAEEFVAFATEAATLLSAVPALDSREEIAAAVCNTRDQLLRQLATLALNLASDTLTRETALTGEPYPTVGAAFDAAVQAANGSGDRELVKDVLDRINNNQNHDDCDDQSPDDDGAPGPGPGEPPPTTGHMTICHIPPGNPAARHTITIGASAWPAHRAHGDTMGACQ